MNAKVMILSLVTLAFGALTLYALWDVGYWGIFDYHRHSSAGWQVFTDLVIVCGLAMAWMLSNARETGRTVWPFILLTVFGGAFGPLLYLLIGAIDKTPRREPAQ